MCVCVKELERERERARARESEREREREREREERQRSERFLTGNFFLTGKYVCTYDAITIFIMGQRTEDYSTSV